MARTIPFMQRGVCIDCGAAHKRDAVAWRCWACTAAVIRLRTRCVRAVKAAIARGDIAPADQLPCVDCGAPAKVYDHRDYSKPLGVQPVCTSCNFIRGPGRWPGDAAALAAQREAA